MSYGNRKLGVEYWERLHPALTPAAQEDGIESARENVKDASDPLTLVDPQWHVIAHMLKQSLKPELGEPFRLRVASPIIFQRPKSIITSINNNSTNAATVLIRGELGVIIDPDVSFVIPPQSSISALDHYFPNGFTVCYIAFGTQYLDDPFKFVTISGRNV